MAESKSPQNPDPTPQPDETLDGAVDADIDMDIRADDQLDGPADAPVVEPVPEAPAPTKKDISLRDFLSKMDDYAPIVCPGLSLAYFTPCCSVWVVLFKTTNRLNPDT